MPLVHPRDERLPSAVPPKFPESLPGNSKTPITRGHSVPVSRTAPRRTKRICPKPAFSRRPVLSARRVYAIFLFNTIVLYHKKT